MSFLNTSSNATTFTWLLNGDSLGNTPDLDYAFSTSGSFELALEASNDTCYTSMITYIQIVDALPSLDFTHSSNGLSAIFIASNLDQNANYLWDFGDGNMGIGKNVAHTYGIDSLYQVCLEIQNACGSFSQCKNVFVATDSTNNQNINYCQEQWRHFTNGDDIRTILGFEDDLWIGTWGGLVQLNNLTGTTNFYNSANSGLPYNCLLYTSPSPRDLSTSRMPSSA